MILIFLICLLLAGGILLCKRNEKEYAVLLCCVATVLIFSIYLYRDYLFGDALYLYATSDGLSQFLPRYIDYVQMIRSGEFPLWSMFIGFGHPKSFDFIAYPLNLIPLLAGVFGGEPALMRGFAWMQVVKMGLSALFLFLFLRKIGLRDIAAYIGSFTYAFSGVMILRGFWVFFSDECYLLALLLYAAELYYKDKKWYFIPPVVALILLCLGEYYVYLYALLLVIYGTVRYVYDRHPANRYLQFLLSSGVVYLIGVLMLTVSLIGFGSNLFDTARFSDTAGNIVSNLKNLRASWSVIASAVFSLFDPNLNGAFVDYSGVLNYLERPLFYCGIACLYLIVQAVVVSEKRMRVLIVFGLLFAAAYMFLTPMTDLFNAFIINEELGMRSYRLSSLWILMMFVVIGAYGLDTALEKGYFCMKTIGGLAVCVFCGFLFMRFVANYFVMSIEEPLYIKCLIFIVLWPVVFWLLPRLTQANFSAQWIILFVVLVCFELGQCASDTIARSVQYAKTEYEAVQEDSLGYYGDVGDAVEMIQHEDDSFYRISGVRPTANATTYCVPQYFGFLDSSYYLSVSASTYRFLNELYPESFTTGNGLKYSIGVGENSALSALTGYKYRIVDNKDSYEIPDGYELHKTVGSVDVLINKQPLSVGLTYDKVMKTSDFLNYSDEQQREILLHVVVVPDEIAETLEMESVTNATKELDASVNAAIRERCEEAFIVEHWEQDELRGTVSVSERKILSFSVIDNSRWNIYVDGEKADRISTNLGFFGVLLEPGDHDIVVKYSSQMLWLGVIVTLLVLVAYVILCKKRVDFTTLWTK